MYALEIEQLRKTYAGGFEALKGISLQVKKGDFYALLGPNGAGKSTTIKMLTGILTPTSGSAQVLGYVPWLERSKLAFHIGAVFGQRSQLIQGGGQEFYFVAHGLVVLEQEVRGGKKTLIPKLVGCHI